MHFDFNFILWISNLISPFSGRSSCPTIVSPCSTAAVMIYGYFYCRETFYRAHVARSAHKIASGSNKFLWLKTDNERVCVEHVSFAFSQYSLQRRWRFQSNHRPSQEEHFVALPHMWTVLTWIKQFIGSFPQQRIYRHYRVSRIGKLIFAARRKKAIKPKAVGKCGSRIIRRQTFFDEETGKKKNVNNFHFIGTDGSKIQLLNCIWRTVFEDVVKNRLFQALCHREFTRRVESGWEKCSPSELFAEINFSVLFVVIVRSSHSHTRAALPFF